MNSLNKLSIAAGRKLIGTMMFLVLIILLSFPFFAIQAENIINPIGEGGTFGAIIQRIVNFAKSLLAPLAVLMVLIAGFLYMTGGGNPEKIKIAHRVFLWAVVGIAIVLIAESVCVIVGRIIGAGCTP